MVKLRHCFVRDSLLGTILLCQGENLLKTLLCENLATSGRESCKDIGISGRESFFVKTLQCQGHNIVVKTLLFRGILVSLCFEPSQPQRITSGLNTNFTLSPSYSLHKSSYHKSCF